MLKDVWGKDTSVYDVKGLSEVRVRVCTILKDVCGKDTSGYDVKGLSEVRIRVGTMLKGCLR